MNKLSIIVPYYNNDEYIEECINSLKRQRNKDFDLIVINDGSTDSARRKLRETLATYENALQIIDLKDNLGHAHARNIGLDHVKTPYVMFLDADDTIASYTIQYYLDTLNNQDALIAPIYKFTLNRPNYVNKDKVDLEYYHDNKHYSEFLRRGTVCNIVFKMAIINAHNIRFNESLKIYVDSSFAVEYIKYVDRFIRIRNFPFYYRGEVYDPFEGNTLSDQDFNETFADYVESFFDVMNRTDNKYLRKYLISQMESKLYKEFNPSNEDIDERYTTNQATLEKIVNYLKWDLLIDSKMLSKIEYLLVSSHNTDGAMKINKARNMARHLKNIVLNNKLKTRSVYKLNNAGKSVKENLIVFESFGGKNYSDSPKAIYEYMQQNYPQYNYIWVFNKPQENKIIGNAKKVMKGSKEYYEAFSESAFWVTNARLPLYLDKKENQTYIQTWHGTPLKRLANDMKVVRMPGTTTAAYKMNFNKETKRWDFLISPNQYSTEIFRSAFWMNDERIWEIGYPRNDVLVNKDHDKAYIDKLKHDLNIPKDKKVIMYAPTWRDDEFIKKGSYLFDLKINLSNLQEQLGDDSVLLLRMHYLIANALELSEYEGFAYDVSDYNDISELYLISDALITDYSSVMFDYGILKRPQFFFAYDIDKYDKGLRGFYMDYHNELPGPIITDPFELAEQLKDIEGVKEEYKKKIDLFYNKFCSIENGRASQFVGDYISRQIEGNH